MYMIYIYMISIVLRLCVVCSECVVELYVVCPGCNGGICGEGV